MTKQLMLIRHAKAEWNSAAQTDFDRSLSKRGHSDAPEMAKRVLKQGLVPELLLSSPAVRALSTARHFAEEWQISASAISTNERIYEAGVRDLLRVVNAVDDAYAFIALFGHNPGLTDFVNYVSDAALVQMPTCGIILMEFSVESWAMVGAATSRILLFDYPKNEDD